MAGYFEHDGDLMRLQTTDPILWTVHDVAKWMEFVQLGEYKDVFVENQIGGEELLELTSNEIQDLGITKIGHKKKLLRKIQLLTKSNEGAFTVYSDDGSLSPDEEELAAARPDPAKRGFNAGKVEKKRARSPKRKPIRTSNINSSKTSSPAPSSPGRHSGTTTRSSDRRSNHSSDDGRGSSGKKKGSIGGSSGHGHSRDTRDHHNSPPPQPYKDPKITIKMKYKGEWTTSKWQKDKLTLKKLRKKIRRTYKQSMKLRYKDDEGDMIAIRKQSHLTTAVEECATSGKSGTIPLKLYLKPFKKKAKTDLSSKEQGILEALTEPVCVIDLKGTIIFFNQPCERLFGYARKEVLHHNCKMLMPPSTAESHDFYLWRYQKDRVPRIIGRARKVIAQHKDGSTFPVNLSVTPSNDSGSYYTGVFTDLHAELAIPKISSNSTSSQDANAFSLLENLLQCVIVIDTSAKIVYFNREAERLSGWKSSEMIGKNVKELMPEPYKSEHDKYIEKYLDTGKAKVIGIGRDVSLKTKAGEIIPVRLSVTEKGEGENVMFTGLLTRIEAKPGSGILSEISKEKSLMEQQKDVLETLLVPAVVIDEDGIVRVFNTSAEELLGYKKDEIIGKNVNMIVPSPDKEKHDRYIKRYLRTGRSRVVGVGRDMVGQRKDGMLVPLRLSVTEKNESGKKIWIGVMQKLLN